MRHGVIFLLLIASGLELSLNLCQADSSPSPSPVADISLDQFDSICQASLENASTATTTAASQKLQYCQSAQSAKDAYSADTLLWKVWAAVAGACFTACAASFAGIGNQYLCLGINAAAGVGDAVITKNYANVMMSIASSATGYIANNAINPAKPVVVTSGGKTPTKPATQKDIGACLIAASAGFQTYTHYSGMKTSEATAKNNLSLAQAVVDAQSSTVPVVTQTPIAAATNSTPGPGGGLGRSGTSGIISNNTASGNPKACGTPSLASGNTGAMMQCAAASDSNLPKFITSSQFPNDFRKSSGLDLGNFMSRNDSPSSALVAAMSGPLNSDQSMRLATAVKNLEQQMPNEITTTYSGGGGGNTSSGGSSDPAMGDMLSGLMGQLMPKQDGNSPQNNQGILAFGNQNRLIAAVPENRTVSIFDRVAYRYYFVGKRMLEGGN